MPVHKIERARVDPELREALYQATPALWGELFVGMNVMLLENICTPIGLANGLVGKVHAIYIRNGERHLPTEPGHRVVELPYGVTPYGVDVAFPLPKEPLLSAINRRRLGRISGDKWVIPLRAQELEAVSIGVGEAAVKPTGFNITQAYSLTIHKSQGLSLRNVVIDLTMARGSRANLTFEIAYVAVSRCSSDAGLRILPPQPGCVWSNFIGKTAETETHNYLNKEWRPQPGGDGLVRFRQSVGGRNNTTEGE